MTKKILTKKVKTIALIAHDNKKIDLVEWATYNKKILATHTLVATGTTGQLLEEALSHPVQKMRSGMLGGDQQIGAKIAEGDIDLIIFFWDPLEPQPHDPDVKALLRLAVAWNIPTACNRSTADFIISSPLMDSDHYEPAKPDFEAHNNRLNAEPPAPVTSEKNELDRVKEAMDDVIKAIETRFRPSVGTIESKE